MVRASRGIVVDQPSGKDDPGSRMVLDNIEHPGLADGENPAEVSPPLVIADENGYSVHNPQTGVTAVWVAGEIVPQWAVDLRSDESPDRTT